MLPLSELSQPPTLSTEGKSGNRAHRICRDFSLLEALERVEVSGIMLAEDIGRLCEELRDKLQIIARREETLQRSENSPPDKEHVPISELYLNGSTSSFSTMDGPPPTASPRFNSQPPSFVTDTPPRLQDSAHPRLSVEPDPQITVHRNQ